MKALILAAGLGTRLGELTRDIPKCLMPVGNSTILELVAGALKRFGVTSLVINLHHHAEKVRSYVERKHGFGLPVEFSFEATPLETGGGILHARALLESADQFLVHNADIFSDADLRAAWDAHRSTGATVTLLTMRRAASRSLLFDASGQLIGWENTTTGSSRIVRVVPMPERLAFTGISVVSSSFFKQLERYSGAFAAPTAWLDAAGSGVSIRSFPIGDAYWIDIGTPAELEQLRSHVARRSPSHP